MFAAKMEICATSILLSSAWAVAWSAHISNHRGHNVERVCSCTLAWKQLETLVQQHIGRVYVEDVPFDSIEQDTMLQ